MERIIKVTGRGKVSAKPDTIRVNINADGTYPEYADAIRKSAEDTELLRMAMASAGLDPKELKTSYFNVNTEYENYQYDTYNWKQKFIGYKYIHSMYIQFPADNEVLGKVLGELSKCGVSADFNIDYTVKDTDALKNELLAKAVSDSREKAMALTEAAGVELGDIVNIDYSWGEMEIYTRSMCFGGMDTKARVEDSSIDLSIEPEDINLQDTVTVIWEIKTANR